MKDATRENLRTAFTQYSAANRTCLAYMQKAVDDKCPGASILFKALTRSYAIQAASMLSMSGGIHPTADNIRQTLVDGLNNLMALLPLYINKAEQDGSNPERVAFHWSQGSGQTQVDLLEKALDQLETHKDCSFDELHVCSICGFIIEGNAPEKCPNCGVNKKLMPVVE
jgi:rubrerythrin